MRVDKEEPVLIVQHWTAVTDYNQIQHHHALIMHLDSMPIT